MYYSSSRLKSANHSPRTLLSLLQRIRAKLRPLAVPALVIGTLILAVASGLGAIKLQRRFAKLALASIVFLITAFAGYEYVILVVIAISTNFVAIDSLPYLFGFSTLDLSVIFLLGLVVVNGLSDGRGQGFVRTALDWPVLLFFGAVVLSLFNAKYYLGTVQEFRNGIARTLMGYLLYFVFTNLIRTRQQLMRLVAGLFVIATVIASFMVAQQVVGPSVSLIPSEARVYNVTALGQELVGVARVSPPGSIIVYVMLFPAFILHVTPDYLKSRKWLSLIPVVLFSVATLFTFDRNMWVGAIIASAAFVLLSRLESSRFVLLVLVLVVAAIVAVFLVGVYFPRIHSVVDAVFLRFDSLFAGDELVYDSSTQYRLDENKAAMPVIEEHPILGIGPMAKYREPWYSEDTGARYIHNAYLYILVDLGFAGLIPFIWFSLAHLIRGVTSWSHVQDPILKGLIISLSLSYIAVLVSNTVAPYSMMQYGVSITAGMLGLNAVAMRLASQTESPQG